ncbi:serine/arginine repetitive matrix protein 1-like [Vanessa cardui]|uniref:serine/arginine repetitive matrix protein 1-like n=1 Tax=Vanessa cardui TaxID=171605 RepID=UPI001F129E6B|nr:serine/arginine repetitive matrix protein 1-like [Vanessa cardui]
MRAPLLARRPPARPRGRALGPARARVRRVRQGVQVARRAAHAPPHARRGAAPRLRALRRRLQAPRPAARARVRAHGPARPRVRLRQGLPPAQPARRARAPPRRRTRTRRAQLTARSRAPLGHGTNSERDDYYLRIRRDAMPK